MIETIDRSHCKMRHENGNCLPMGGFCTAVNDEVCAGLQAAHAWGVREALRAVPSADVKPVVFCRNCVHWNAETHGCTRNPSLAPWWETDFCNYGEKVRKE